MEKKQKVKVTITSLRISCIQNGRFEKLSARQSNGELEIQIV